MVEREHAPPEEAGGTHRFVGPSGHLLAAEHIEVALADEIQSIGSALSLEVPGRDAHYSSLPRRVVTTGRWSLASKSASGSTAQSTSLLTAAPSPKAKSSWNGLLFAE